MALPPISPSMHLVVHDQEGEYHIEKLEQAQIEIEYGYYNGDRFVSAHSFFDQDDIAAMNGFYPASKTSFEAIGFTTPVTVGQEV